MLIWKGYFQAGKQRLLDKLKSKVTTPFVYGRGKRKMQVSKKFIKQRKQESLTEIVLVAMAYNINKLHRKIQDNRTGTQLHGKLSD